MVEKGDGAMPNDVRDHEPIGGGQDCRVVPYRTPRRLHALQCSWNCTDCGEGCTNVSQNNKTLLNKIPHNKRTYINRQCFDAS